MSKYTKTQVIAERRCGLKYFDKAVALESRNKIIEEVIKNYNVVENRNWGDGWKGIEYSLGGIVEDICFFGHFPTQHDLDNFDCSKWKDISMTWNANEALTDEEMLHIADKCGLNFNDYKQAWPHKDK